jgi:hypothetical protein
MPDRAPSDNAAVGRSRATILCGWAAIACYAVHATLHLVRGEWYDLFWACHIAALFVGGGFIARNATLNGAGVLLGLMGLPLWLADLASGGEFLPTSILTHIVALCIGLYGTTRFGLSKGAWLVAAVALVGLIGFCRLVTPPGPNVNVAYAIQHGWESRFASHGSYLAWMVGSAAVYFFVVERFLRFLLAAMQRKNSSGKPTVEPTATPQSLSP